MIPPRFLTSLLTVLLVAPGALWAADSAPPAEGGLRSAQFWFSPRIQRRVTGEQWLLVAELDSEGLSHLEVRVTEPTAPVDVRVVRDAIPAGRHWIEVPMAPSPENAIFRVHLAWSGGERTFDNVGLKPPRHWTIHLSQHTHTDIGYTRPQTEILPESLRFIDTALDFCDLTDGLPDEARFRWTCETLWAVREYLSSRPPEQVERLKRRVREGRIEIAGMLLNLSEIATESSLTASLQSLRLVREVLGAPVRLAMQNDVNGAAWCLPDYFDGIGIRYLTMGINQTRSILPFDLPTPFWWESPSGKRVLAYRAEHYMLGNFWGLETGDRAKFEREMSAYLQSLEGRGYALDRVAVQFSGYFTDNSPPSMIASEFVRRWNEDYAWPRLRLSTAGEFLAWVEAVQGKSLPVHRQAWPDWWTDGFGSAARETAASRETHAAQRVSEALLALATVAGQAVPGALVRRAAAVQENLMFYDEHTYGAAESISDPLAENTQVQWGEKSAYAWTAVKEAALLREQAFGLLQDLLPRAEVPTLAVVNALNWSRSGPVRLFIDHETLPPDRAFVVRDMVDGQVVAAQALSRRAEGTYWVFWVREVPAMGYRMLRLEVGEGARPLEPTTGEALEVATSHFQVTVDPAQGGVVRLVDRHAGLDLVDPAGPAMGQLIHETLVGGRDFVADRFRRAPWQGVTMEPGVAGPLWRSLILTGRLEGCATNPPARLEIRVYEAESRVEFHYSVRKLPVTAAESVYVAFPFGPSDATLAYEAQGGWVVPGRDQLPGSASDWQTVQSALAIRHADGQYLWSSTQAPLVQLGGINLGKWQRQTQVERPHVYSWVMNNYWFTNFRVSQEGDFRWSYSLSSTPDTTVGAASRFGWSCQVPLVARALAPLAAGPSEAAPMRSLLTVDAPGVLLVDARPAGENAVWLHLREVDGRRTFLDASNISACRPIREADETNVLGEVVRDDIDSVVLEPYAVKFVRLQLER